MFGVANVPFSLCSVCLMIGAMQFPGLDLHRKCLRFKLDKKNRINSRIDLGFGRAGRAFTIGVGEAF